MRKKKNNVYHPQVVKPETGQEIVKSFDLGEVLLNEFISSLDLKDATLTLYRKGVRYLFNWLLEQKVINPQIQDLKNFKDHLKEEKLSTNSINSYIVCFKKFFSWLHEKTGYPNIGKEVRTLKQGRKHKRKCFSDIQVRKIIDSIKGDSLLALRNRAILMTLSTTSMRTIELIRADIQDLEIEGNEGILMVQMKGRDEKDETKVITEDTLKHIEAYLRKRKKADPQDPLFANSTNRKFLKGDIPLKKRLTTRTISLIVKETGRAVGIDDPKLCAHSLRHFAISFAMKGGASLHQVQAMAGHSDPRTTQIYWHNIDRIENAAERCIKF